MIEFFRDIGGLGVVLFYFFEYIFSQLYAKVKINAIIVTKGYFRPDINDSAAESDKEKKKKKSDLLKYGTYGWLCKYFFFCQCCYNSTQKKTMQIVEEEVAQSLDLLNLIRRLRVHGECLNTLMDKKQREQICEKVNKRNLDIALETTQKYEVDQQ